MKDIGAKIFGIVLIILGVTSIVVVTIAINETVSENEMTEQIKEIYKWSYGALVTKSSAAGLCGIYVVVSNQQSLNNLMISARAISGDDNGGVSGWRIYYFLEGSSTPIKILFDETTDNIVLPNDDYLGGFQNMNLEHTFLIGGDRLYIGRTNIGVGGQLIIDIRADLSVYSLPVVTLEPNVVLTGTYINEIVAVL